MRKNNQRPAPPDQGRYRWRSRCEFLMGIYDSCNPPPVPREPPGIKKYEPPSQYDHNITPTLAQLQRAAMSQIEEADRPFMKALARALREFDKAHPGADAMETFQFVIENEHLREFDEELDMEDEMSGYDRMLEEEDEDGRGPKAAEESSQDEALSEEVALPTRFVGRSLATIALPPEPFDDGTEAKFRQSCDDYFRGVVDGAGIEGAYEDSAVADPEGGFDIAFCEWCCEKLTSLTYDGAMAGFADAVQRWESDGGQLRGLLVDAMVRAWRKENDL